MDSEGDLVSDSAGLVVGTVVGTGTIVADALGGADELIKGARRAGPRRLFALVVVIVVGAAAFKLWKSRQGNDSADDRP